jgi:hypothetical protein
MAVLLGGTCSVGQRRRHPHEVRQNRTPRRRRHRNRPASLSYNRGVAETITFRPDEDAARALAVLTQDGTTVSMAVRSALISAARDLARASLRAEAEALAADPADRAEAAQVLLDLETLRVDLAGGTDVNIGEGSNVST